MDESCKMNVCVVTPGAGSLRAKFELSNGPSSPSTLAVQFMNEASTLSGVDMELQGAGYRLSLNKKRFATGKTHTRSLPTIPLHISLFNPTQIVHLVFSLFRTIYGRLLR